MIAACVVFGFNCFDDNLTYYIAIIKRVLRNVLFTRMANDGGTQKISVHLAHSSLL